MANPAHPAPVSRIAAFVLIGAGIGFYVQDILEREHRAKQLEAYERYLERTAKTTTKKRA